MTSATPVPDSQVPGIFPQGICTTNTKDCENFHKDWPEPAERQLALVGGPAALWSLMENGHILREFSQNHFKLLHFLLPLARLSN